MADARELLEWIKIDPDLREHQQMPIRTVNGYRTFERLLTDILDRIERLEEQG